MSLQEIDDSIGIIRVNLPAPGDFPSFTNLGIVKDGIYKRLEYCLQNIFDICSILNRDLHLGVPASEDQSIQNLVDAGIISQSMGEVVRTMKGLRNILVHQYGKIDDMIVYEILNEELDDIMEFCSRIDAYITNTTS